MTPFELLILSFFIIALIYASVGFAGGSSYLAMLALMGVSFQMVRTTALLCNILVAIGGVIIFYRNEKLDLRKTWPLVISSVPFAYLGGVWPIQQKDFFILLGAVLVLASLLLWLQPEKKLTLTNPRYDTTPFKILVGGGLGLLSGLVGIGGGIFLSPILHFIRWDEPKRISAAASFFILVNSIGGIIGQSQQLLMKAEQSNGFDWNFLWPLLLAVFIGGQVGSWLGVQKFNPVYIKRITAVLIFAAGTKILIDNL